MTLKQHAKAAGQYISNHITRHSGEIKAIGLALSATGLVAVAGGMYYLGYFSRDSEQQPQTSVSKSYNPMIPKFDSDIAIQRVETDGKVTEVPMLRSGTKKVPVIGDKTQKPRTLDETVVQGNDLRTITGYAEVPAYNPYQAQQPGQYQELIDAKKELADLTKNYKSLLGSNESLGKGLEAKQTQISDMEKKINKLQEALRTEPPKPKEQPVPEPQPKQESSPKPLAPLVPVYDNKNIRFIRRLPDSYNRPYLQVEFADGKSLVLSRTCNNLDQDVPFRAYLPDLPYDDLDGDGIGDLIVTFPDEERLFLGRHDSNAQTDSFNRPNLFIPSGLSRQLPNQQQQQPQQYEQQQPQQPQPPYQPPQQLQMPQPPEEVLEPATPLYYDQNLPEYPRQLSPYQHHHVDPRDQRRVSPDRGYYDNDRNRVQDNRQQPNQGPLVPRLSVPNVPQIPNTPTPNVPKVPLKK